MTDYTPHAPSATAPGWYADPDSLPVQRYWTGSTWTEHTREAIDHTQDGAAHSIARSFAWEMRHLASSLIWVGVLAGAALLMFLPVNSSGTSCGGNAFHAASIDTNFSLPPAYSSGDATIDTNATDIVHSFLVDCRNQGGGRLAGAFWLVVIGGVIATGVGRTGRFPWKPLLIGFGVLVFLSTVAVAVILAAS